MWRQVGRTKTWRTGLIFAALLATVAMAGPNPDSVRFYGVLVDKDGLPVRDATVHGLIYESFEKEAKPASKVTATTDAGGLFDISVEGARLEVLSIRKQGYEFSKDRNTEVSFIFAGLPTEKLFVPDAGRPVVFTIRKKSDPAFLTQSKSTLRFKPDQE